MLSRAPPKRSEAKDSENLGKKMAAKPSTTAKHSDRSALQRKLEDLERVQLDTKKAHAIETDRLKLELAQTRKSLTEHTDRFDKQKKHTDALETRLHDLKKVSLATGQEVKELKLKLRTTDQDRAQLLAKQNDATELRKAAQTRQEDLRGKDRRIVELEKTIASEKKRRVSLEARVHDIQGKDTEIKATAKAGEMRAQKAHQETSSLKQTLDNLEQEHHTERQQLLDAIEHQRNLLSHVAATFGQLHNTTISTSQYDQIKDEKYILQLQNARLERRLANSEAQVTELALYLRHLQENRILLQNDISDLESMLALTSDRSHLSPLNLDPDVDHLLLDIRTLDADRLRTLFDAESRNYEISTEHFTSYATLLLPALIEANGEKEIALTMADQYLSAWRNLHAERDSLFLEKDSISREAAELKAAQNVLEAKILDSNNELQKTVVNHNRELQKERQNSQRLMTGLQNVRQTEDDLRAEVDTLTSELTEAERFQEAFYMLRDEVDTLSARNELAQGEADRLGKMNAQILGHCNPAQRIMYVDKIRQELAETKQNLLRVIREQEAAKQSNNNLQNELDMYTSITVPTEKRIGTKMTRLTRNGPILQRSILAPLNQSTSAPLPTSNGMGSVSPAPSTVMSTPPSLHGLASPSPNKEANNTTLSMADILDHLPDDDLPRQSLLAVGDLTLDDLI